MELRPLIASYIGQNASAIRKVLDNRALEMVARVAESPVEHARLDPTVCAELLEMHVFRQQAGRVWLDTAVFLEEDIRRASQFALDFGGALADVVIPAAALLAGLHPDVLNFLVGIVAIGQSLHHAVKDAGLAVNWSQYEGRYASSKVDFEEVCAAANRLEPDLQTKGVERGVQYTAVLIGPGRPRYYLMPSEVASPQTSEYIWALNRFLTDAFPMLLTGKLDHPALREAAERVGLFRDGCPEPVVITNQTLQPYLPALDQISQIARAFYVDRLDSIHEFLGSTASGRQNVPDANMAMHLWRYIRRGISRALYAKGFFTDRAPETGLITVFFENDVEYLNKLLS